MKYVWRLAFIGVILSPMARAEVVVFKKNTASLRAFQNYDKKMKELNNYSVLYWETKKRYVVMKSAPARQQSRPFDGMTVALRPSK